MCPTPDPKDPREASFVGPTHRTDSLDAVSPHASTFAHSDSRPVALQPPPVLPGGQHLSGDAATPRARRLCGRGSRSPAATSAPEPPASGLRYPTITPNTGHASVSRRASRRGPRSAPGPPLPRVSTAALPAQKNHETSPNIYSPARQRPAGTARSPRGAPRAPPPPGTCSRRRPAGAERGGPGTTSPSMPRRLSPRGERPGRGGRPRGSGVERRRCSTRGGGRPRPGSSAASPGVRGSGAGGRSAVPPPWVRRPPHRLGGAGAPGAPPGCLGVAAAQGAGRPGLGGVPGPGGGRRAAAAALGRCLRPGVLRAGPSPPVPPRLRGPELGSCLVRRRPGAGREALAAAVVPT